MEELARIAIGRIVRWGWSEPISFSRSRSSVSTRSRRTKLPRYQWSHDTERGRADDYLGLFTIGNRTMIPKRPNPDEKVSLRTLPPWMYLCDISYALFRALLSQLSFSMIYEAICETALVFTLQTLNPCRGIFSLDRIISIFDVNWISYQASDSQYSRK